MAGETDNIEKALDQVNLLNQLHERLEDTIKSVNAEFGNTLKSQDVALSLAKQRQKLSSESYETELRITDVSQAILDSKRKIAKAEDHGWTAAAAQYKDNLKNLELFKNKQDELVEVQKMSGEAADELANSVMGIFDKIPIGGKFISRALGIDELKSDLSKELTQNFKAFFNTQEMSAGNLKNVFSKSFASIGKAASRMLNPSVLIAVLLLAAVKRFSELDKAAEDFRKTTGLTASQTLELSNNVRTASRDLRGFGVTAENIYKSAAAFAAEFDNAAFITKDLLKTSSLLSANYGISEETTAKTVQNFMQLGNFSAETAGNLIKSTTAAANMAGVAPAKVMGDIANASETTLIMMRGNAKEMARTAIQARILGTDMESVAKSARGMLNFQESINSEMEASTLLGKNLNFQAARQAAFEGDVVKSRELAMKQIERAGDITKMNAFQQEALAKAAGMTVDEIQKQVARKKQLAELEASDPAKYARMMSAQSKITELNKESIDDEITKMEMQGKQAQMMNQLLSIWASISDILVPIVDIIASLLLPLLKLTAFAFNVILSPIIAISDAIGWVVLKIKELGWVQKVAGWFDGLSDGMGGLASRVGKVVAGLVILGVVLSTTMRGAIGNLFTWIGNKWKSLMTVMKKDGPGQVIKKSVKAGTEAISSGLDKVSTSMSKAMTKMSTGMKSIGTSIGHTITKVFTGLARGLKALSNPKLLIGVAVLAALAASMWVAGKSFQAFAGVDWAGVYLGIGALSLLAVSAGVIGSFAPVIALGALVIAGLGLALIPAAFAMKMFGDATAIAAKSIVSVIPELITLGLVSPLLYAAAGAMGALGLALASLGAGSIISSIGKLFGGGASPFESLINFSKHADNLQQAANAITSITSSFDSVLLMAEAIDVLTMSLMSLNEELSSINTLKLGMLAVTTGVSNSNSGEKTSSSDEESELNKKLDRLIQIFEENKFNVYIDKTKLVGALQTVD